VSEYLFERELWEPLVTEDLGVLAVKHDTPIPLLMEAFEHQTQWQTMAYYEVDFFSSMKFDKMNGCGGNRFY
jgi:hypothetical protein